MPVTASAHPGRAIEPHDLWSAFTLSPMVIVGLLLAVCVYARGVRTLWHAAGRGRGITAWRVAAYYVGLILAAVALLSPIDALGEALFSGHMVQHMLLVVAAAPCLTLGDPLTATLWALPLRARRSLGLAWRRARLPRALWRQLRRPVVLWVLHVGALWLWHLPTFYDAALRDGAVHVLEHATFLLTALLFWLPLADPHPRRRLGAGVATLYLFTAALQCTLLGALITFAPRPWYFGHLGTTAAWGLSPLEDQQLAGLIMWIPAGLSYLIALVPSVLPALRAPSQWPLPAAAGVSVRGTP
jgi:putative membrane protein